jgi:hypothetical protein
VSKVCFLFNKKEKLPKVLILGNDAKEMIGLINEISAPIDFKINQDYDRIEDLMSNSNCRGVILLSKIKQYSPFQTTIMSSRIFNQVEMICKKMGVPLLYLAETPLDHRKIHDWLNEKNLV